MLIASELVLTLQVLLFFAVLVGGPASVISLLVHGVVTGTRYFKQRYREKGPTMASFLLTLPGLVAAVVALVIMLSGGIGAGFANFLLAVFRLSVAILLFVWFAPWSQHIRAISQDRNVSVGVALRQVAYQNRLRFLMAIGASVLLVLLLFWFGLVA